MAQEPRVAAADADARQERRRAEEQHHQKVPGLRELQLLERAHVGPDEVDRQQVREAEGPVVEEAREGPPARGEVKRQGNEARHGDDRDRGARMLNDKKIALDTYRFRLGRHTYVVIAPASL